MPEATCVRLGMESPAPFAGKWSRKDSRPLLPSTPFTLFYPLPGLAIQHSSNGNALRKECSPENFDAALLECTPSTIPLLENKGPTREDRPCLRERNFQILMAVRDGVKLNQPLFCHCVATNNHGPQFVTPISVVVTACALLKRSFPA